MGLWSLPGWFPGFVFDQNLYGILLQGGFRAFDDAAQLGLAPHKNERRHQFHIIDFTQGLIETNAGWGVEILGTSRNHPWPVEEDIVVDNVFQGNTFAGNDLGEIHWPAGSNATAVRATIWGAVKVQAQRYTWRDDSWVTSKTS